jgi:hypothetical protein
VACATQLEANGIDGACGEAKGWRVIEGSCPMGRGEKGNGGRVQLASCTTGESQDKRRENRGTCVKGEKYGGREVSVQDAEEEFKKWGPSG